MKTLSRILTMCLYVAPLACVNAWGVVATTDGHNLTAYHPSDVGNNQWATLSNGRGDMPAPKAKADFGNCNSIILRCAQPKCRNGGCVDANVATAIVAGCVQSSESCKQYGNELVSFMSAQMVATSTAKANAQQASAAAAAAAQTAQSEQTSQQLAQMQQQMQQQMAQMQQQMAEQNAQTQQQLQNALAKQQEQNAAALEDIKNAATPAPVQVQAPTTAQTSDSSDPNLTAAQKEAIEKGITDDVLERQKITGKIMTMIENADTSLAEVKKSMTAAFEYAGCDARGNGCLGPKRVKKFRELALDFIDPYDNVADQIYDALDTAQLVGVDITPIYMMLNDSCKEWGYFLCPHMQNGQVMYKENGTPEVCPVTMSYQTVSIQPIQNFAFATVTPGFVEANSQLNFNPNFSLTDYYAQQTSRSTYNTLTSPYIQNRGSASNSLFNTPSFNVQPFMVGIPATDRTKCRPCTLNKKLTSHDEIYAGWVDFEADVSSANNVVVACASGLLESSKFFQRRAKRKNGAGIVDIDFLDRWLSQVEPNSRNSINDTEKNDIRDYCYNDKQEQVLRAASLSKSVSTKSGETLCVDKIGSTRYDEECPYINPIYAICDTHVFNKGEVTNSTNSSTRDKVHEIVALKTTVVAQQMYKQYEYLAATLRRLKTHLEKAVFSADVQMSGAKSGGEDSESSWAVTNSQKSEGIYLSGAANCYAGDTNAMLECLRSNLSTILGAIKTQKKKACQQLVSTVAAASDIFASIPDKDGKFGTAVTLTPNCKDFAETNDETKENKQKAKKPEDICKSVTEEDIRKCVNGLTVNISSAKNAIENNRNRSYRGGW